MLTGAGAGFGWTRCFLSSDHFGEPPGEPPLGLVFPGSVKKLSAQCVVVGDDVCWRDLCSGFLGKAVVLVESKIPQSAADLVETGPGSRGLGKVVRQRV